MSPGLLEPGATTPEAASAEHAAQVAEIRLGQLLTARPPRFAAEGDLDPRIATWAQTLTQPGATNLIISGGVGAGKTWSAWHAAEHAIRAGFTGRTEFVGAARWREVVTPPPDFAVLRVLGTAELLILDDLAAGRLSEWDQEHLYGVMDARSAAMLPTLVTTNITDLRAMFGDRVASRIAESLTKVMFKGGDRRRAGAA
jgi:DNA replication protein DnaC